MPSPRSLLIDPSRPGWVHAIARCVRRAFLAGGKVGHRRQWVEDRLKEIAGVFACDVAAYAVMSNHVHVVVRLDPQMAVAWSDREVAERWCALFGKTLPKDASGRVTDQVMTTFLGNAAWIAERRARLCSLSWFMRALCEDIARRANREDDCTGRFWEGRFTSVPLLDQAALIACMAYVDLNPVRAKMADVPEKSAGTGVRQRVRARQRHRVGVRAMQVAQKDNPPIGHRRSQGTEILAKAGMKQAPATPEEGMWVCRMHRCVVGDSLAQRRFTADDYLTLVDATGRMLKAGKRGAIPPELKPILARLDVSVEDWLATLYGWRSMIGGALGHAAARVDEAVRRGKAWVRNRCPLFVARHRAA